MRSQRKPTKQTSKYQHPIKLEKQLVKNHQICRGNWKKLEKSNEIKVILKKIESLMWECFCV